MPCQRLRLLDQWREDLDSKVARRVVSPLHVVEFAQLKHSERGASGRRAPGCMEKGPFSEVRRRGARIAERSGLYHGKVMACFHDKVTTIQMH